MSPVARIALLGAMLVALIVIAFLPAFGAEFLNLDDDKLYTLSFRWRGLDAVRLRWMFGTTMMGHYQPLTWVSAAVDYALHGLTAPSYPEAGAYHATNVLLHAAGALALFALAARLFRLAAPAWDSRTRVVTAAAAAALWAVHPLRVESVVWLTERRDVLSAPFFFLALYGWLGWATADRHTPRSTARAWAVSGMSALAALALCDALDFSTASQVRVASPLLFAIGALAWTAALVVLGRGTGRGLTLGLTAACMLLSLLAKAWGIVLPALFALLDVWPRRRVGNVPMRELIAETLPFFALAIIFARIAQAAQASGLGVVKTWTEHPFTARIAQAAYGLLYYPAKTLAPLDLQPLYALPHHLAIGELPWLLAVAGALASSAVLIACARRAPAIAAAFAAYAVIVSPVLGFTQSGPQLVADRYAYVAGAPFAILVAGAVAWLGAARRSALVGAALVLLALTIATYRQATYWRTSTSLWERAYAIDPDNPATLISLGTLRARQGQVESDPGHARALLDEAFEMQQRAYALDESPLALRNMSQVQTALSLVDSAEERVHKLAALDYARRAVEMATAQKLLSADYLNAYGIDLLNLGQSDDAAVQLARAAALDPDSIRVLVNLGEALSRSGKPGDAVAPLTRAVQLESSDVRAWTALAETYEALGRGADALAAWRRVLALTPHDATAAARVRALAAGSRP